MTGSVSLGGATLDAFGTITCSAQGYHSFSSTTTWLTPSAGTFAGLANGDIVSINAQDFVLFYDGGNGNDVVLVAHLQQAPSMSTTIRTGTSERERIGTAWVLPRHSV